LEVEATTEFYRLWSALLFLYCMRETKSSKDGMDPIPDDSEFGHGFLLAGAMFIHLLGMRVRCVPVCTSTSPPLLALQWCKII